MDVIIRRVRRITAEYQKPAEASDVRLLELTIDNRDGETLVLVLSVDEPRDRHILEALNRAFAVQPEPTPEEYCRQHAQAAYADAINERSEQK